MTHFTIISDFKRTKINRTRRLLKEFKRTLVKTRSSKGQVLKSPSRKEAKIATKRKADKFQLNNKQKFKKPWTYLSGVKKRKKKKKREEEASPKRNLFAVDGFETSARRRRRSFGLRRRREWPRRWSPLGRSSCSSTHLLVSASLVHGRCVTELLIFSVFRFSHFFASFWAFEMGWAEYGKS